MTLRKRLTLIAGASVGVAVLIAVLVSYFVVRSQLLSGVDGSLQAQQTAVEQTGNVNSYIPGASASSGGPAPYNQIALGDGQILRQDGGLTLPVPSRARSIANAGSGSYITDVYVGDTHLRMLCFPVIVQDPYGQPLPAVLELARPLNQIDAVLRHLRAILTLLLLGGIALAAALGRMASRRVLSPLAEVAEVARHIGETDDLSERLHVHADDEVGQLALRFNKMLDRLERSRAALDRSVRAQRQLVADASHELRTPVTSLRTNVEVLLESGELGEEDRHRLLSDVVEQSEELTSLVADLIELARGDQPVGSTEEVRLDRLVAESVAWARRNASGVRFETSLAPVIVEGVPERLERAVNNLLDNAAHHSPPGGTVGVTVDADGLLVRDHGDGIEQQDLPHVFDRFFRGANSRHRQGSGLGLAIVKQVAEQHGGTVSVANAADRGAIFRLALPTQAAEREESEEGEETAPLSSW